MKKIFTTAILIVLLQTSVFAVENDVELNEKLAGIGFGKIFALEPETQIKKMFGNYVKYSNKHDLNKICTMYDEKYVNSDGFDFATYKMLIKKTWEAYPDISYTNEIKSIVVNGDYATVQAKEFVKGNAKEPSEYLEDKGYLESDADIVYYLKRNGSSWVIVSDSVLAEKTFLKYGEAKDIAFDIIAPATAVAGEEYSVLFAADLPKNKILLGSITNEKITYPAEKTKEVFRKLKEDGILERFVRANSDGFNEQATVAVGITKPEVDESKDIKFSVSGVAFLISRVNVVQPKKFEITEQDKSNVKNAQ